MPKKLRKKSLRKPLALADDLHDRLRTLISQRIPWLLLGVLGGVIASQIVRSFETILLENLSLAYFVPAIVYMSDAVGTQTETIFVRTLAKHKIHFMQYLARELVIGLILGAILGSLFWLVALLWLHSFTVALIVGVSIAINVFLAPILSVLIPELLFKKHSDPAIGAGPFTTVILDILSLMIYFLVATLVFWYG